MRYIALIILSTYITGCATHNTSESIYREINLNSLFNKNRTTVESEIGANLEEFYGYYFEGSTYTGNRYNNYVFIFENNALIQVVNFNSAEDIWENKFTAEKQIMPYFVEIPEIHKKLSSLSLYNPNPASTEKSNTNISDGIAAGIMVVLAAPLIPIALTEIALRPKKNSIDWDNNVIGESYQNISAKIGQPIEVKEFRDGYKIYGFKQQYFWIPHYVGTRDGNVIWVLHKSFALNKYFGH